MSLAVSALLWFHVLSAIGWMGAAMVFAMVVSPSLPAMSPAGRGEFVTKVLPKYIRYVRGFVVGTPLLGVATAFAMAGGDFSVFAPTTSFGLFITAGGVLTLLTVVVFFAVVAPSAMKLARLTEELAKSPGQLSPEIQDAGRRLRVGATTGLVLLAIILFCMVAAGS